ncbi:MAG: hypothetical protein ACTSQO_04410 [Candidatus Helarchaeota archaeon]
MINLKNKVIKYIPFIILGCFTFEMSIIVGLLLFLPNLLFCFIPLYLANLFLIIKFLINKYKNKAGEK